MAGAARAVLWSRALPGPKQQRDGASAGLRRGPLKEASHDVHVGVEGKEW